MQRLIQLFAMSGLLLPVPAVASPLLLSYTYVRYYSVPSDPSTYACSLDNASCTGSTTAPGTNWTVNYSTAAATDYGVLRANSSLYLTGDDSMGPLDGGDVPLPHFVSVGARAGYQDSYTVSGGTGSGTLDLQFTVDGTSSATPGAAAGPLFQLVPVLAGVPQWDSALGYSVGADNTATVPLAFTFGQPVEYVVWFYALSQVYDVNAWTTGTRASADYFDTAVLTGIRAFDSSGEPISSFSIASASGTHYGASGVEPAPEPGSLVLFGMGLTAVVRRARRPLGRRR
jgi:hypothetical protein